MWWLRDLYVTPPGGAGRWVYIHPESGARLEGGDYRTLLLKIREHETSNNYPIGSQWEENIQNRICMEIGDDGREKWCAQGMKGLGDVLHLLFNPVALAVDGVLGTNVSGCGGCQKRRDQLNEIVPFTK